MDRALGAWTARTRGLGGELHAVGRRRLIRRALITVSTPSPTREAMAPISSAVAACMGPPGGEGGQGSSYTRFVV
ncbi:hypothetical protein STRIP9103_07422 [Streptomyces ipomoeae 91-03]|uniref:Uncharacterized protein n=1 Tax=Streptomyces ipomoeae 91-03 TaxID=698759 RepID=L1KIQ2_9ACTN|nr:hypothetical protein STRIP9103_07422 [Streptomyces ipomoeae 91-03]